MNLENFKRVLAQIEAQPETWNQECWHTTEIKSPCGTAHCFAGWSEIFATDADPSAMIKGTDMFGRNTRGIARRYLDLKFWQAEWLFDSGRTLTDFRRVAETGVCPEDDE